MPYCPLLTSPLPINYYRSMTLDLIGLLLITAGWALQALIPVKKKALMMSQGFLILYSAGIVLIVASGLSQTIDLSTILNVVSALLALSVLFRIYK